MWPSKEKGFMTFGRELPQSPPVEQRVKHYEEFACSLPEEKIRQQAYRCMNCGVPFCHSGCPLGNSIPDFHEAVKNEDWRRALEILHSTNNFPEFTGRVCPAPCEAACVLGINEPPVTIEYLEREIVDRGWREGWIKPEPPASRTGKRVAVVGSGPAGLAAAQQLNRAGHNVVVYERDDEPGGLLMYGIPAFKLTKPVVHRRIDQMKAEGVEFRCDAWIGNNVAASELDDYDAVLLAMGSTHPRALDIPGSGLDGIHMAVPFLRQQTRRLLGKPVDEPELLATGKNVVVIGGGDTGSDCIGTSMRQGAKQVHSLEIMPQPPLERHDSTPWPMWPLVLRTSSSHEEGGQRQWSVLTKSFEGENGCVTGINAVRIEWLDAAGHPCDGAVSPGCVMREIPGSEFKIDCELVLLALGFLHPEHDSLINDLGLALDNRKNIKTDERFQTSLPKFYSAGDARRGQSLIVWAICEGREAARSIDIALTGRSDLPGVETHGYDTQTR